MKPLKKLYVAGPMSGLPALNHPAFNAAASALRDLGFEVENPAENHAPNDAPAWGDWMRVSIQQMMKCDAVALLPGWQWSQGARVETRLAEDLDMPCHDLAEWLAGETRI